MNNLDPMPKNTLNNNLKQNKIIIVMYYNKMNINTI